MNPVEFTISLKSNGPAEIRTQDLRRVKATTEPIEQFRAPIYGEEIQEETIDEIERQFRQNSRNRGKFRTFNDLYEHYRDGFVKWLNRRVKTEELKKSTVESYLSAVDRYLITEAEDDITKPFDFRDMSGDKQTRGTRNFLNYLKDIEVENPLGYSVDKWLENVNIRPSGVVEIYPSNEEIIEAYNACPTEFKVFFKALVYTGCRFSQLYAALHDLNPNELTYADNVAHVSSANLSAGTKRSYRLFFPAEFVPELEKITFYSEDHMKKSIQYGRVSVKTIRKWHYNFMIVENGVSPAAADFMQGRAPTTVGTANYLDKVRLTTTEYQKVVDSFPIPPTAGDKIPLPTDSAKLQPERPKSLPNEEKTGRTLNSLWENHCDRFYKFCEKEKKGIIKKKNGQIYNAHGGKLSSYFRDAPKIKKPTDVGPLKKPQVTALRLFLFDYLPSVGEKNPLGYSADEWKSTVNYAKN